jgi:DNA-binding LytR/AlgR family response regulator
VFVTAHDDHAIQAFSVDAVDYLLKPVSEDRLQRCIQRVAAIRGTDGARRSGPALARVPVTRRGETLFLDIDDVLYAEADGDRSVIHTDVERLPSSQSMRELEDQLPSTVFFRIHRSYLVNLRRVAALEQIAAGRTGVRLTDDEGTVLEVARRQVRGLKQHLGLRA